MIIYKCIHTYHNIDLFQNVPVSLKKRPIKFHGRKIIHSEKRRKYELPPPSKKHDSVRIIMYDTDITPSLDVP